MQSFSRSTAGDFLAKVYIIPLKRTFSETIEPVMEDQGCCKEANTVVAVSIDTAVQTRRNAAQ